MMQVKSVRRIAVLAAAVVILVAPGGCSSESNDTVAEAKPTRVVIDGQARTVEGKVACVNGPTGEMSIEVDKPNTSEPVVVLDLTPQGDTPSVSLLSITLPDIALSAGRYRMAGVPTATKAGDTYTIKGRATVVGTPPEKPLYKELELELTCP